jgi:hypothetical protein
MQANPSRVRLRTCVVARNSPRNQPWLVQIYELSDKVSQEILTGLLAGVPELTVDAQSTSNDVFLIVDCVDSTQPRWVHRLVTSVDRQAVLLYKTSGRART